MSSSNRRTPRRRRAGAKLTSAQGTGRRQRFAVGGGDPRGAGAGHGRDARGRLRRHDDLRRGDGRRRRMPRDRHAGRTRAIPERAIQGTADAVLGSTPKMLGGLDGDEADRPATDFLRAAEAAGVDLTDERALTSFVAGWNARGLAEEPAQLARSARAPRHAAAAAAWSCLSSARSSRTSRITSVSLSRGGSRDGERRSQRRPTGGRAFSARGANPARGGAACRRVRARSGRVAPSAGSRRS